MLEVFLRIPKRELKDLRGANVTKTACFVNPEKGVERIGRYAYLEDYDALNPEKGVESEFDRPVLPYNRVLRIPKRELKGIPP